MTAARGTYFVKKGQVDHVLFLVERTIEHILQRKRLSRVVLETYSLFAPGLGTCTSIGENGSLIGVGGDRNGGFVALLVDQTRGDPRELFVQDVDTTRGRLSGPSFVFLAHGVDLEGDMVWKWIALPSFFDARKKETLCCDADL
jgi:hypothetical protein